MINIGNKGSQASIPLSKEIRCCIIYKTNFEIGSTSAITGVEMDAHKWEPISMYQHISMDS